MHHGPGLSVSALPYAISPGSDEFVIAAARVALFAAIECLWAGMLGYSIGLSGVRRYAMANRHSKRMGQGNSKGVIFSRVVTLLCGVCLSRVVEAKPVVDDPCVIGPEEQGADSEVAKPGEVKQAGKAKVWSPLLIFVDCRRSGRTRACPSHIQSVIEDSPLLKLSSRAEAEVILQVNATQVANDDILEFDLRRHAAKEARAKLMPAREQLSQTISTRADQDTQIAVVRAAVHRVLLPFMVALMPESVKIDYEKPKEQVLEAAKTSPWAYFLWFGGWMRWAGQYRDGDVWAGTSTERVTAKDYSRAAFYFGYNFQQRPELEVEGEAVSLDLASHYFRGELIHAHSFHPHWSWGVVARGGREDPSGRYRATARLHGGVAWDLFKPDDAKGNMLQVGYILGWQFDAYHQRNALGETWAQFPSHGLLAMGEVVKDDVTFGLQLSAMAELIHANRRYVIDVTPRASFRLGDRVDLNLEFSLRKQAVPGPAEIDAGDVVAVTRADYAQPLSLSGSMHFEFHWDRSNGVRNNRWSLRHRMNGTDSL